MNQYNLESRFKKRRNDIDDIEDDFNDGDEDNDNVEDCDVEYGDNEDDDGRFILLLCCCLV